MSVETKYLDHFRLPLMIILSTVSILSGTPVLLSDGDETAASVSQGRIRSNVDLIGRKLMERNEYLTDPCGKLSIPYWKAKTLVIPDSIKIIHYRDWSGQYSNYQRFFRIMHDLKDLCPIDFDYDTLSVDYQAADLAEMINASYSHENTVVTEKEILEWRQHETFREDLCICINADDETNALTATVKYEKGNCVEIKNTTDEPPVTGDPDQLTLAFLILIGSLIAFYVLLILQRYKARSNKSA